MRLTRAGLALALLAALAIAVWRPGGTGGFLGGIEGRLLDARFALRGPRPPPDGVVILAIDDRTIESAGRFPPPRTVIAKAIRAASESDAAVVAVDLLLAEESSGDDALAQALRSNGRVILAVSRVPEAAQPDEALAQRLAASGFAAIRGTVAVPAGAGVIGPQGSLAQAAAAVAHVNVPHEPDGALRRVPLALAMPGGAMAPALPLEAARRSADLSRGDVILIRGDALEFGEAPIPLDPHDSAILNYYGPKGTIATYSVLDAADVPLSGKAVFIGATATGYGDTFATPFDARLPGVEALATLAANIEGGDVLRRDETSWALDILLAVSAAAAGFWAAARDRLGLAIGATAATAAVVWGVLYAGFRAGYWLDGISVLSALAVAAIGGAGIRMIAQKRRTRNLARYQSPVLAETLAAQARPDFDRRNQDAAALFVDLAGFTARSEHLGHGGTAAFLRDFHGAIERAALAHHGVVEQFAGDGAMIIFGLPEPRSDDAASALECAETLFAEIAAMNAVLLERGEAAATIRVGAHFGLVTAAVLGGSAQSHVTVTGDVVNGANRLQEIAKRESAALAISDALLRAAGGEKTIRRFGLRRLGPEVLRGLAKPVDVWIGPGSKIGVGARAEL